MKKDLDYYLKLNYEMVVIESEEGGYFIKYPDLKGCITCVEKKEDIFEIGEDAKKIWLQAKLEMNSDIPEPKDLEGYSGNFRLRIPKELHLDLSIDSSKQGISMNQYCIYLLSKGYEKTKV